MLEKKAGHLFAVSLPGKTHPKLDPGCRVTLPKTFLEETYSVRTTEVTANILSHVAGI